MTDVSWRAFSGYLTDIRSSGSDIRWISESEGLPMRKPCGWDRRTRRDAFFRRSLAEPPEEPDT